MDIYKTQHSLGKSLFSKPKIRAYKNPPLVELIWGFSQLSAFATIQ